MLNRTPVFSEEGSIPLDWTLPPEIPVERYTSGEMERLERDLLWNKTWLCIGREENIAKPGDYVVFERMGKPIVLVRGKDDVIRAFYNICRHRGARVASAPSGHTNLLRCQFHSWSYSLAGELVAVPRQEGFPCLDKKQRSLVPVRCEGWDGWIFVNFDDDAPALRNFLGSIVDELSTTRMNELRIVDKRSFIVDANWKTTMDAFLEAYHLDTIHPQTAAAVNDARHSTIQLLPGGHSWESLKRKKALSEEVVRADTRPEIAGIDNAFRDFGITYTIFPNIVAPIDPVGFPVLLMWPIDINRCEIEVYFLGPQWEAPARTAFYEGYFDFFDRLMNEDMENLASIQRSFRSGAARGPLMGYQERRAYWLHQAIDTQIGLEALPAALRVSPALRPE